MNEVDNCERFEKYVGKLFGDDVWNDKEFQDKYMNVLKDRENPLDDDSYGCCDSTMDLMRYITGEMRSKGLIPNKEMDFEVSENDLAEYKEKNKLKRMTTKAKNDCMLAKYRKIRCSFLKDTPNFEKKFHDTFTYEINTGESNLGRKYNYGKSGWKKYSSDSNTDWIKNGEHYYFNELDHLFTYLIGHIRNEKEDNKPIQIGRIKDDGLKKLFNELDLMVGIEN